MKKRTLVREEIVYGLFDNPVELERAYQRLVDLGVAMDDISLLLSEDARTRDFRALGRTHTAEGVVAGSAIGGALGGVLGGLVSLGAVAGGGLLVLGPAIVFAAAGGLLGGLVGRGVPEEEAQRIQDALDAGKALIAVHVRKPEWKQLAKEVLKDFHAEEVEFGPPHIGGILLPTVADTTVRRNGA